MDKIYDFCGWATKNDIQCSDGRIIRKDAFEHNDGQIVPLVWNHSHNDPFNILGHALLENREKGVYMYGTFNDTEQGKNVKSIVEHGDVTSLSIYANKLKQRGCDVIHGAIKEVSLVLANANPGAYIESVIAHGEESEEEAIIYSGEDILLEHSEDGKPLEKEANDSATSNEQEDIKTDVQKDKKKTKPTVGDVFKTLNEDQKKMVYTIVNEMDDEPNHETPEKKEEGGNTTMKHNAFENDNVSENEKNTLSHSEMNTIIKDAKRLGSLRESFLEHAEEYGIKDIEFLFPDAKNVTNTPTFIQRDMGWVQKVMSSIHKTPFSRIKSTFADITEDEARAKGYMKGNKKKEEVFSLLKRTTSPTTVYKKQKIDRDDVLDITDFDVVAWLKSEMRMMLDEEIARSILIGDGRLASSDDKIKEDCIRPIANDEDLFTIQAIVDVVTGADADTKAKAFIRKVIKARKDYKGSGNPTMFTTEDIITDCLLLEDKNGRTIYESVEKLAIAMRCKEIISVPPMDGKKDKNGKPLLGIMVNLNDYNCGADKGGSVNFFDDFDIDYNAQKYLIETRCSGALVLPYSSIIFTLNTVTPETF